MLKIGLRERQGWELANAARRNQNRSHWYRLIGMRRWALILLVADESFVSEADPSNTPPETIP